MDNPLTAAFDTLRETVRETFETLTFSEISGWKVAPSGPDTTASPIGASLDIHLPFPCRLTLLLDRAQCREFVETAYGPEILEDPGIDRILADYVCELVNTIGGRLAAALAQADGLIELGLPWSRETPSRDEHTVAVAFLLERTPAWCFLEMNPSSGPA